MNKKILLSFDLEEFDLPSEYGQKIEKNTQMRISKLGLLKIMKILEEFSIKATFFVTSDFALRNKKLIKDLSKKHEIASHSLNHSSFSNGDIERSKRILEKMIGKKVYGFRMPRLKEINTEEVKKAGYIYDSSLNPTFIPGRYNNLFKNRKPHFSNKLLIIPISNVPIIRFPLFWLSFKVLPLSIFKFLSYISIKNDSYLNIFFHPWEFSDLQNFNIPGYIRGCSGEKMTRKFKNYLMWLKNQGTFISMHEFYNSYSQ